MKSSVVDRKTHHELLSVFKQKITIMKQIDDIVKLYELILRIECSCHGNLTQCGIHPLARRAHFYAF
jgi:hypothetical protein